MPHKIIIAGGTGFIGQALVKHFLDKNFECVVIGRDENKIKKIFSNRVKSLTWEQLKNQGAQSLADATAIINLAGTNIGDKRWTEKRKKEIIDSRVVPTHTFASLCALLGKDSPPLFNASAIGVYGLQETLATALPPALDENTLIDFNKAPDFLAAVGRAWEEATLPAKQAGVRVVNMRFAVVLGKSGGVLSKLKIPFYLFIGGPIGTGHQAFCWVSLSDLIRGIDFLLEHPEIIGPVNLVAPGCINQAQFAQSLGKIMRRPAWVRTPAFVLKLVYGQMADELLLRGQHVKARMLSLHGFEFKEADINLALQNIFLKETYGTLK